MVSIKEIIIGTVIVFAFMGLVCGGYWIAKTVSYSLFYSDMVEQSIVERVKPECLK